MGGVFRIGSYSRDVFAGLEIKVHRKERYARSRVDVPRERVVELEWRCKPQNRVERDCARRVFFAHENWNARRNRGRKINRLVAARIVERLVLGCEIVIRP